MANLRQTILQEIILYVLEIRSSEQRLFYRHTAMYLNLDPAIMTDNRSGIKHAATLCLLYFILRFRKPEICPRNINAIKVGEKKTKRCLHVFSRKDLKAVWGDICII